MDILDGFLKLVLTRRTISISIGLDCWDPQGKLEYTNLVRENERAPQSLDLQVQNWELRCEVVTPKEVRRIDRKEISTRRCRCRRKSKTSLKIQIKKQMVFRILFFQVLH